jgi:hypothetical protein
MSEVNVVNVSQLHQSILGAGCRDWMGEPKNALMGSPGGYDT